MLSLRGFLSLVAFGLLAAGAITVINAGEWARSSHEAATNAAGIDYFSFTVGLIIGIALATASRWPWGEFPRRLITWLWENERNFYRVGMAAVLIGVLVFY
jgi:hypothetical protein